MPRTRVSFAVLLVVSFVSAFAQSREVVPVPLGASAFSLNGLWEFKYVAGPKADAAPVVLDATITVPGHWELQGFAAPKYGKSLNEGMGYYRRTFTVPATWSGQRVMLRFDGVLFGFEVLVNSTKVGSWASGYNPATFDITDQLKPGTNVLDVAVTTRSHGWEFDTNDCWSISGIYRDVTLFAVPAAHLQHFAARTKLAADGSATLTINTLTTLPAETAGAGAEVKGRLLGPDGKLISDLKFASDKPTVAEAHLTLPQPQLWTAETPVLYTLELELSSGQRVTEKIGLREVSIVDGVLKLNGRPIKLHGVDHHDIWPEQGRVATEALMRRDLELMRAANINFIRTSHYPPHPRFLQLCDELGFYVMDEVPFGFGEEHLADENYREALLTRAHATVLRDENHPSIIVWSVGNENPNTPLTIATARRVKELDPTRPVCFPQIGGYFAKSYPELPADIDIYAPHYPSTKTVQEYAEKLTRPVIFTEYAHALGLASDQIQAQWALMQANPRLAGGAIWMFQDQGIRRTATPEQAPATSHDLGLAVWPDATHYYDTNGNQGMDGIVYSDRTPQVDYWQVRKVYSPVQVTETELPVQGGANRLTFHVENRYDFRSLAGVTLEWTLMSSERALRNGFVPLQAAAHSTETVTVDLPVPASVNEGFHWLALRFVEKKVSFHERSLRLQPAAPVAPLAAIESRLTPATPKLEKTPAEVRVTHPAFSVTVARDSGEIILRNAAGDILASGFRPHTGRRFTEGEFIRAKKELTWTGEMLQPDAAPTITTSATNEAVVVSVTGRYPRPNAPAETLAGEVSLRIKANGLIEVSYDFTVQGNGLLLEAGLALAGAPKATEFSWIGAGPYAGWPGKDRLNEFGRHHLNSADLNFQGNRRQVEVAQLGTPAGVGFLLIPATPADVSVENVPTGTILSHNAIIAGRGTKFVGPDNFPKAESTPRVAGRFTLLPLTSTWLKPVKQWLGSPAAAEPFTPYFHSYDQ